MLSLCATRVSFKNELVLCQTLVFFLVDHLPAADFELMQVTAASSFRFHLHVAWSGAIPPATKTGVVPHRKHPGTRGPALRCPLSKWEREILIPVNPPPR